MINIWINGILALGGIWLALIAQALPSPNSTGFLTVLGSLMVIAVIISTYYQIMANRRKAHESYEPKRRLLPDPLRVINVEDFVSKSQFEKLDSEIDRKFENVFTAISSEGRRVDARINDVLKAVSALEGAFHQSQRRHHPNDR